MHTLIIIAIGWYLFGILSSLYYDKKNFDYISISDVLCSLIIGLLGPIILIAMAIDWFKQNFPSSTLSKILNKKLF